MECLVLVRENNRNTVEQRTISEDLIKDQQVPWIHLKVKNRDVFSSMQSDELLAQELLDRLQQPGKSFLVERIGNTRLLDCNVNYDFDEVTNHQLTFIFYPGKVLTISTVDSLLAADIDPEDIIEADRNYDANLIVLTIFRRMLDRNTSMANKFSKKVDALLKQSIAQAFDTTPKELERLHSRAIDLNELLEDQLTTVRLLPMNIEEENLQLISLLDRIEKSMEYLVSITERSLDKLDYILQRYASVLQQKANSRLNTLTILQAIFVPLTFIAGIYGMNFINMPELEWPMGYYYALTLMAVIGLGALFLFYRNGWFK